jgi:hypothetical protein
MSAETAEEYVEKCRRSNPGLLAARRISIKVEEFETQLKLAWLDGALSATKPLRGAEAGLPPGFAELFSRLKR